MDFEKEFLLTNLQCRFLITLKNHLVNMNDTLFLYRVFDLLKNKYTDTIDVNFLETIRTNINRQSSSNILYIMNGIVYNYRNEELMNDFLKCFETK